jgi:predicted enzyme involved in methoxymalonyl-ACP biosynthesis
MSQLYEAMTVETVLRKRKAIVRELQTNPDLLGIRVAVLGSSTTNELADLLEIQLLSSGLRPTIYQGSYNLLFEETVLDPAELISFRPDIVVLHTSSCFVQNYPAIGCGNEGLSTALERELERFRQIWASLFEKTDAVVIQNNFEPLTQRVLGNQDAIDPAGRTRFLLRLNEAFAMEACLRKRLFINDIAGIVSKIGADQFLDGMRWLQYKILTTPAGTLELARSLSAIFRAIYGRSKKCLILDLDNTLWGGVIGDDGVD